MPEIWLLKRGRNDPMVYPFETEEQAEDFKLDHGMLDWRAERGDDPEKEHEPVCHRCRERWPCRHIQVERQAQRIIAAAENTCHRCKKQIGWRKITFKGAGELGEDIHYHGKLGACFNEAKRLAAQTQDEDALKDIKKAEYERALGRKQREWRDSHATR